MAVEFLAGFVDPIDQGVISKFGVEGVPRADGAARLYVSGLLLQSLRRTFGHLG